MIEMPRAFHSATDDLPSATGRPPSAQGKKLPATFPIGGAMRYRAF